MTADTDTSTAEMEPCPRCPTYTGHTIPEQIDWIQCDGCQEWYHLHCIGLSLDILATIVKYYCPGCIESSNGALSIVYKRSSARKRTEINYVALNDGDVLNSFKDNSNMVHPYIRLFQEWTPPPPNTEQSSSQGVIELKGSELTLEYALKTKMPRPVRISASDRDGLGLHVPEFTLDQLVRELDEDYGIEVMNVLTQENEKMSISDWRDYFLQTDKPRDRILNVLSLEISHIPIGANVKRPSYVEDIDLVDKVWPVDEEEEEPKPKVSKYCLMGVENSYTDFHLDFAGTSVYYTVLKGSKQFIFFPPTELNLKKYYKWIKRQDRASLLNEENFLASNGLEKGIKVELTKGDLLIIPSGWIHAVWTPVDSIVIGGNFLTCFNIDVQFKIIELEIQTKVSKKFKFPNFNKLMVLTALEILRNVDEDGVEKMDVQEGKLNRESRQSRIKFGVDIDLKNCKELYAFMESILKSSKITRENTIPKSLIPNRAKFLKKFAKFIALKESEDIAVKQVEDDDDNNKRLDNHENDILNNMNTQVPDIHKKRRIIKNETNV
jgi:F-box/leucine-rich repeat protein 10/11